MENQQILNQSKKTENKQNHNYQRDLDKILAGLTSISKPTLLLHACCGPCSSYVLEYLVKHFQITVFYFMQLNKIWHVSTVSLFRIM